MNTDAVTAAEVADTFNVAMTMDIPDARAMATMAAAGSTTAAIRDITEVVPASVLASAIVAGN